MVFNYFFIQNFYNIFDPCFPSQKFGFPLNQKMQTHSEIDWLLSDTRISFSKTENIMKTFWLKWSSSAIGLFCHWFHCEIEKKNNFDLQPVISNGTLMIRRKTDSNAWRIHSFQMMISRWNKVNVFRLGTETNEN